MRDLGTECARGSPPRPSDRRGASDCTQGPSLTAAILGLGPSRASRPRHFEWPHDVAAGLNLLWNQSIMVPETWKRKSVLSAPITKTD